MTGYTEIKSCRVTKEQDLVTVLDVGNQKLTGVFPRPDQEVGVGPLNLVWSPSSCLVQLKHTYEPTEMYGDNYGYLSSLNNSMVQHLSQKAKYLADLANLQDGDVVVDIGSNDCTFLKALPTYTKRIGIDPTIKKFAHYYPEEIYYAADFFSNHPFHVVIEDFSRRIIAPPKKGSTLQTKWFYERARGQYAEARSQSSTPSERKKFDTINPRSQLVTKTDLAIVMNTFRGFPNIVSKGAQKSFTNFSNEIKKSWKEDEEKNVIFNEQFFKSSMCRVLIFRSLEKLVSQQEWYEGGYRRNIVTYALSKLQLILSSKNKRINYTKIWAQQYIPEEMEEFLIYISKKALNHLINTPPGTSNVTEYAKTEKCWEEFKKIEFELPNNSSKFLISKSKESEILKEGEKKQEFINEVDLQKQVINYGGSFWAKVLEYSSQNNLLTQRDWTLLNSATAIPRKIPASEKDFKMLMKLLERARKRGFNS